MSPETKGLLEWLAGGGLIVLIGLVFGVIKRQNQMNDSLLLIRGALIGYEGKGGLVERLAEVERQLDTVDERIRKSKHEALNHIMPVLQEVETSIRRITDDHEARLRPMERRGEDRRHEEHNHS